eukprot:TRINITY_DN14529_c0_g1_i1.p1 TRINITY_DN14529_c0_g1~~TRINITY_DN14529_c0_g1_i1.p1  ORF type:complete len:560 (+),score=144.72 TRINITY_DN14529_c0_g1_i1:84-1682(+)
MNAVILLGAALAARPNFLILFADDMGYGDPSVYGNPTVGTPGIDKLASEGVRFTQWYSGFHVCSPSRASMLTGRLPIRSGCAGTGPLGGVFRADAVGGLPTNETTFANLLGPAGYRSLAIGKWHVGQREEYLPTNRGFDEYYGVPYSVDMGISPWRNGKDEPGERALPLLHNTTIIEQPCDLETLTQRYADKADDFLTKAAADKASFFLYLAWSHVHVPNFCSQKHCGTSRRGRFGDAMAELDDGVSQVMASLQKNGLDENTVVFFSSDNGPWLIQKLEGGSAGPLREGKTTTWEGGVRVPGIVRWKGTVAPRVSPQVVATYDIFPTMLKLAGVEVPKGLVLDGRDMSQVLMNETAPTAHQCVFIWKGVDGQAMAGREDETQAGTNNVLSSTGPIPGLWAVRCGSYKAHYVTNTHLASQPVVQNPPLLYNIEYDISETYPIDATSQEYQQVMAGINASRAAHIATITPVPNQMARGTSSQYDLCSDPHSQQKYPTLSNCTITPSTWSIKAYTGGDIPYSSFGPFDPYCKPTP